MKKILLIVTCLIGLTVFAQQEFEISPNSNAEPVYSVPLDTFNLQFMFPCIAFVGEYGVETNGTYIYVAQWYGDSFAKYDQLGNLIEIFSIPGVERVRDMAYDGQYYYGGNNNDYYYVLDLENKVLIETIHTTFNIRGMAYDAVENVLWTSGNWEPDFHKLDMQGNVLDYWIASGITMHSITGLAYDNYSYGGPSLWGFSQDSSGVMIVKYDITTQSQTGNMIDMSSIATGGFGYAGGLFINEMTNRSDVTLGGVIQNDVVFAFDLAYVNQMVVGMDDYDMITSFDVYPIPASDKLNISFDVKKQSLVDCRVYNQMGQLVYDQNITTASSTTISIDISMFNEGIYYLQLSGNKGYSFTKEFIKMK